MVSKSKDNLVPKVKYLIYFEVEYTEDYAWCKKGQRITMRSDTEWLEEKNAHDYAEQQKIEQPFAKTKIIDFDVRPVPYIEHSKRKK